MATLLKPAAADVVLGAWSKGGRYFAAVDRSGHVDVHDLDDDAIAWQATSSGGLMIQPPHEADVSEAAHLADDGGHVLFGGSNGDLVGAQRGDGKVVKETAGAIDGDVWMAHEDPGGRRALLLARFPIDAKKESLLLAWDRTIRLPSKSVFYALFFDDGGLYVVRGDERRAAKTKIRACSLS